MYQVSFGVAYDMVLGSLFCCGAIESIFANHLIILQYRLSAQDGVFYLAAYTVRLFETRTGI